MKLVVGLFVFMLASCAPLLQPNMDTHDWAARHDSVFRNILPPSSVNEFEPLRIIQEVTGPTNLTIRQHLILGRTGTALDGYKALSRDSFWVEGPTYWRYTKVGFDWAGILGPWSQDSIYPYLAAPDGSIAVPEAGDDVWSPLGYGYDGSRYYVRKWPNVYLLIALDTSISLNLHKHLEAGYFALWVDTGWVVRCNPYTGWGNSRPLVEDGFYDHLPKWAVTPVVWRVYPPKIKVTRYADGFGFVWKNKWRPESSRRIFITDSMITVSDRWGLVFTKKRDFKLSRP